MRVAIVSNGNFFSTRMLRPLFFDPRIEVVGVVSVRVPPGRGGPVATLRSLAGRTGYRYAWHKLGSLAVPKVLGLIGRTPVFLDQLCRARATKHVALATVNSAAGLATLRAWQPDVLISVSSPERFDPDVLRIASVASINLHWGLLPAYAGIAPYFWVLRNGEKQAGLTIHEMVPELDAGNILRQRTLDIGPTDTSLGLQLRLMQAGAEELIEAVRELPGSLQNPRIQDRQGRSYFTWMKPEDVRALRARGRKLARLSDYGRMREILKDEKRR